MSALTAPSAALPSEACRTFAAPLPHLLHDQAAALPHLPHPPLGGAVWGAAKHGRPQ